MIRREIPKSIERWLPPCEEEVIEAQPYNYADMPDDLPSVEHWYKVRECYIYQQERLSQQG